MTAEHLKKPRIQDRIWLMKMAALKLEAAISHLRQSHLPDPMVSKAQQESYSHWHLEPLEDELDLIWNEIHYLEVYKGGDGVRRWMREPEPVWEEGEE